MGEFLEGLKGGNITDDSDTNDLEELEVMEADDDLVVEAQAAPPEMAPEAPPPVAEPAPAPEENLEVTEDPAAPPPDENLEVTEDAGTETSSFDGAIDNALKNVTINDVVQKLESLAKIFKTREVPRQLAFVDMMLDTLGISSFFPSLAEATNKSLESNQYVLTRIEDILSKLRGTMASDEIDLSAENPASQTPEMQALKNKLQNQEDNDKAKKKMRKELEDKKLQEQSKEEPEVEIEEDLSQPTEVAPASAQPPPAAAVPPPT